MKIDGLLADLGVSSYQFDTAERGFSTRLEGELDMRMNINSTFSAKNVVNNYPEEALANIFYKYGEIRNSKQLASRIVFERKRSNINTTSDLINVINNLVLERYRNKFYAKVFQAIRIEVNDEISALEELLLTAEELLKPGARLVVISYHSLEDRLIKNIVKKGNIEGNDEKDFFGNLTKRYMEINKKVIVPSNCEINENSRARSAKLRIAERTNVK